ncbi:MAG: AMP-binding protein [Burkholderiales bacterium]|nr:AMP-binding protein [Burkholderiales bacterium]
MKLNFCRVMRQLALRHGDREAIVNVERNRRYSFAEYHRLTNRVANALRGALGVARGDRFMMILENDNLCLLQFPTFFKQEGTAALTNLRDSAEEHRRQIELIRPKVVFIESRLLASHLAMLREQGCGVVAMDPLESPVDGVLAFWDLVAAASDEDNEVALDQHDHTVLLRFIGGTTGRGKCAMYSVDNMMGSRDGAYVNPELGFDGRTRFLHVAPLSHGTQLGFYPSFFVGGTNLTLNALDLELWSRTAEAERVTHSFLVPTALYRLLDLQKAAARNFSSLRTLLYGAAPMSPTRLNELVECFGPIFAQGYASTEAAMFVSVLDQSEHRADSPKALQRLSSAGRVTPGVEVFVTDGAGRQLPPGRTGEIRIRCRSLIQGYYANPESTAAEFEDGAWKSGDLGYLDDDGFLYIVDRLKDMIISGGFNVYAVEVEAALAAHPAVLMSAVVGVPHADWGEAVHAEVVLRQGASAGPEELAALVKARLGSHKAPKTIRFVDALPLSAVGKVLRRQVREKYWHDFRRQVG